MVGFTDFNIYIKFNFKRSILNWVKYKNSVFDFGGYFLDNELLVIVKQLKKQAIPVFEKKYCDSNERKKKRNISYIDDIDVF